MKYMRICPGRNVEFLLPIAEIEKIVAVKHFAYAPMNMRQIILILLYEGNEAIFLAMGYTCVRGAT